MATAARRVPDWGARTSYPLSHRISLVAINAAPWAGAVVLTLWVITMRERPPDWTFLFVVWVGVGILIFLRVFMGPPTGGIRGLKVGALPTAARERVTNLVAGLARDHGLRVPDVYAIRNASPNAIVFRKWGPAIGLTTGLLEEFTRTELEAVLAHCLVRLNSPYFRFALVASFAGGARFGPPVGVDDDVRAVALTRFPPGLAGAIAKAKPADNRYRPLWFVADGPPHRPVRERIAALQDV
jgi:hypothetical protein